MTTRNAAKARDTEIDPVRERVRTYAGNGRRLNKPNNHASARCFSNGVDIRLIMFPSLRPRFPTSLMRRRDLVPASSLYRFYLFERGGSSYLCGLTEIAHGKKKWLHKAIFSSLRLRYFSNVLPDRKS